MTVRLIHVGTNNIIRERNDTDMNNLPESILEIAKYLPKLQNIHIGYTTIKAVQNQYITNQ